MFLASKIERVLHFAAGSLDDCPEFFKADVILVKNRYIELKRSLCWDEAARQAKTEWIKDQLEEFEKEIRWKEIESNDKID